MVTLRINHITPFWLIIFILLNYNTESQIINKFGLKGGAILNNISAYDDDLAYTGFYKNHSEKSLFLSYDIGFFAEFFDSPKFCVSGELHYNIKGEDNKNGVQILAPDKMNPELYTYQFISNRFSYISLQLLPQWRFELNSSDKLYLFAGPKFDYRISNNNSDDPGGLKFPNSKIEFGFAAGIGNIIWELVYLELKYEHSFTNIYTIKYGNETYNRFNQSFILLMGVSLKKLLKINL